VALSTDAAMAGTSRAGRSFHEREIEALRLQESRLRDDVGRRLHGSRRPTDAAQRSGLV